MGGKWEFPGGKLESGEHVADAAIREFDEEFGLAITVGTMVGQSTFQNNGKHYELAALLVSFDGEPMELCEHDEVRWVDAVELNTLDLSDSDRSLVTFVAPLLVG